ncbi:MAG: S26 family signal peptidase [Eubacteriales bacterium]|nr:S26 family signal peptidase [Eubacteriales bacterium]
MKKLLGKIQPFIIPITVTLAVIILFHSIFMLGYVPSASMEPTLDTGSLILGLRIHGELKTQDIIIFRHDGTYMIKRIAATEDEQIVHNGQTETVPENCFYVLGDNALDSYDSRYWEDPYVKLEDIMAKLLLPVT